MEQLSQQNKIAIVGGGPSGIYCAINLLEELKNQNFSNYSLDIFDKSQILRTILATGNGRCNITNAINDFKEFASNYPRGEKFLYSIFSKHFTTQTLNFFKKINIETYCQEDGRIFPKSNSAKDVKDKLIEKLKKYKNVKLINKEIKSKEDLTGYSYIIIASGSRNTENLIKSYNHTCIEFKKALCALNIKNPEIYPQGVSVKSLDGDFIFTEKGISGPLVFKISSLNAYKKTPYDISIKLFESEALIELIKKNPKKSIGNLVSNFIPKSLSRAIIKEYDKNSCEISKDKIKELSNITFKIISTTNKGEIVNAGGVDLREVDKNCKSKNNENLWFCGEILNIDGYCGGFNLQNCWSTGYVVANDVAKKIIKDNGGI